MGQMAVALVSTISQAPVLAHTYLWQVPQRPNDHTPGIALRSLIKDHLATRKVNKVFHFILVLASLVANWLAGLAGTAVVVLHCACHPRIGLGH